jgi:diguanylate cyclase (GGDEF)-like protein
MEDNNYILLKKLVNLSPIPSCILTVEKNPDGSCGEVRFYAINEIFKKSYYDLFAQNEKGEKLIYEHFEDQIEGKSYTAHLPKEPNFEEVCFRSAWKNEYINTYVDTTKMYGYWTQDILSPVNIDTGNPNIRFCKFEYTLNKDMDSGKFSSVSPDIASFVIQSCIELRNERDFESSMDIVTRDIREYTGARSCCVLTVENDLTRYKVVSANVRDAEYDVKKVFSNIPYKIIDSWKTLLSETNNIIIKDDHDFEYFSSIAPEWIATMEGRIKSLVLVPFEHQGDIIGYLYITNFNVNHVMRIKETLELLSFFISAEVANHLFLERLEYLSNVDMLTGVYNRNCMNVNVDELSLKLEFNPRPFNVAFCDLNGLKTINDNEGHESGDKLLVYAASVLKEVFTDDKIFRAGGDEFSIISFSTEAQFEEKIRLLREKASDPDWLYFAVGYYHDEDSGNLRLAMRYADERMYIDKNEFYKKYPDKRR